MSDCSNLELLNNKDSPSSLSLASRGTRESNEGSRDAGVSGSTSDSTARQFRVHSEDSRAIHPDRLESQNDFHQRRSIRTNRTRAHSESSTKSGQLRYGAKNVIELIVPVSMCMIIVVGTMKLLDNYNYSSQSVNWYGQMMFTDQSADIGTKVWHSFANAFIMLICIMVMTSLLIILYKFRCYKTIHAWLILSSSMLLFMFALMYVAEILNFYNIPVDNYTVSICMWNFGIVGMICIHWKGPLLLQQGYLVTISALMALVLIRSLPDWTGWTVLAIVSVWDLVAVLSPRGPLRMLVETAQERNEPIFPALIYSSTMVWEVALTSIIPSVSMANKSSQSSSKKVSKERRTGRVQSSSSNDIIAPSSSRDLTNRTASVEIVAPYDIPVREATDTEPAINHPPPIEQPGTQVEEEGRGVKLGLGDFIFFSVLVGKASTHGDWTITVACYVAILVGLCLTLSLLAVFRKALPALPISIAIGLCFYFLSYPFVVPFAEELTINQVFI